MNFLSRMINKTPNFKNLSVLGEGANGIVYDFTQDKVLKISKRKTFNDGDILSHLQGISTFPVLYDKRKNWYISEKFVGECFINANLNPDWKEVFLSDVEEAFDRGWEIADLKLDNIMVVDGYIKMFDVGMFSKSDPSEKINCLYWIDALIDDLRKGIEKIEIVC